MLFCDLTELKKCLEVAPLDNSQDWALNFYAQVASELIMEILDRPGFDRMERTEYYSGTNTQKLLLRSRPVVIDPVPQCWVDRDGNYGQTDGAFASNTQLTWGQGFDLMLDITNPTTGVMDKSRCGILYRKDDVWPRPIVRQQGFLTPYVGEAFGNIKVVYTGGYTVDDLPAPLRFACIQAVMRIRWLMPLGVPTASESYEERAVSLNAPDRFFLLGQVKDLIYGFKNWKF